MKSKELEKQKELILQAIEILIKARESAPRNQEYWRGQLGFVLVGLCDLFDFSTGWIDHD